MADEGLEIIGSPAPVADASPAPAPPPVVEAAPAPASEPAAPTAHAEPTLLESIKRDAPKPADKPADPKPVEKAAEKPVEAAKPADKTPEPTEKPVEPVVEAPVNYDFKFAEGIVPQAEKVAAFTEFAREMKMTPEQAQKAVGYFNDAATAYRADVERNQIDTFTETRKTWRNGVMSDPELGGSGHMTAMKAVARIRDENVSSAPVGSPRWEKELAEFDDFCRYTGGGDHPALLRLLHNVAAKLDEPKLPPPNPKPVPNGKAPSNSLYKQPASRQ
jgi:hypothetical protein